MDIGISRAGDRLMVLDVSMRSRRTLKRRKHEASFEDPHWRHHLRLQSVEE